MAFSISEEKNTELQSQLEEILIENNYQLWNGRGQGADDWTAEESFFIANISQELAGKLATDFKQNAYVFGSYNSNPQLIFCCRRFLKTAACKNLLSLYPKS